MVMMCGSGGLRKGAIIGARRSRDGSNERQLPRPLERAVFGRPFLLVEAHACFRRSSGQVGIAPTILQRWRIVQTFPCGLANRCPEQGHEQAQEAGQVANTPIPLDAFSKAVPQWHI